MSDQFYLELLVDVNSVIDEFGTTYQVKSPAQYSEETMSTTPGTVRSVIGLVSDQSVLSNFASVGVSAGIEATSQIWVSKKVLLLKASANVLFNETITVDGKEYPLSKVEKIKPANVNLLYILDLTL
jgi:hypothetical protein